MTVQTLKETWIDTFPRIKMNPFDPFSEAFNAFHFKKRRRKNEPQ